MTIPAIQGAAHRSPLEGRTVETGGVVTAVDSNGFYLQDPAGDGDDATSDAVFVFTGGQPGVAAGDAVTLRGTVSEFVPGGAASNNLPTTQLSGPTDIAVVASGNTLPAPVVLGERGRRRPTEIIEDDNFAAFKPETDGADSFESLEAMRVTVRDAVAVAPTSDFGEIYAAADDGAGATNLSQRGTLNIEGGTGGPTATNTLGGDFNPERIQFDDDAGILPGFATPVVSTGARLGPVTGVVSYAFGNYEVLATEPYEVVRPSDLRPEASELRGGEHALTTATYNVLNLDPNDADGNADVAGGQFAAVAGHIARNLNAPDIIGLHEIQDDDGSADTDMTSAALTLRTLADAIAAAGRPRYAFVDNPFITDDETGGEPGGNIRTALLYREDRVDLVEGSVRTVVDPADQASNPANPFADSRLPLAADFAFGGETVTVVANHFTSKGGSAPRSAPCSRPPTAARSSAPPRPGRWRPSWTGCWRPNRARTSSCSATSTSSSSRSRSRRSRARADRSAISRRPCRRTSGTPTSTRATANRSTTSWPRPAWRRRPGSTPCTSTASSPARRATTTRSSRASTSATLRASTAPTTTAAATGAPRTSTTAIQTRSARIGRWPRPRPSRVETPGAWVAGL